VEGEKTFSDILATVALIDGTEEIALIHIVYSYNFPENEV